MIDRAKLSRFLKEYPEVAKKYGAKTLEDLEHELIPAMELLFSAVTVSKKHSPTATISSSSTTRPADKAVAAAAAESKAEPASLEKAGGGGGERIQKPAAKLLSGIQNKLPRRELLAGAVGTDAEDKVDAALAAQVPDASPGADAKEWAKKQPTAAVGAAAGAAGGAGSRVAAARKKATAGVERREGSTASGMHSHMRRNAHKGKAPVGRSHHHDNKGESTISSSSSGAVGGGAGTSDTTSSSSSSKTAALVKVIISPKAGPSSNTSSKGIPAISENTPRPAAMSTSSGSKQRTSSFSKKPIRAPARFYRSGDVVVLEPRQGCGWEFRVLKNRALLQPHGRVPGPTGKAVLVGAKWALLVLAGGLLVAGGCFFAAQREAVRKDEVRVAYVPNLFDLFEQQQPNLLPWECIIIVTLRNTVCHSKISSGPSQELECNGAGKSLVQTVSCCL